MIEGEEAKRVVCAEICDAADRLLVNLDRVRSIADRRERTTHEYAMMVVLGMRAAGKPEEDVREILDLLYELSIASYDALDRHVKDHEYRIVDEEGRE